MTAITESKNKSIYKNTSVFDLNLLTNPLFVCNIKEEVKTIEYLENNCSLTDDVKNVLNVLAQGQQKESLGVVYRKWFDGNGIKKELLIANSFPTLQTADVWDGLIGLYLSKITPITFDSNNNCFSINEESFEFTLYELAKFMHKSTGGSSLAKLDEEIIKLKNATYFSFSTDVFYDKKNGSYLNIKRDGLSFILDYRIGKKNVKGESKAQKCSVQFNKLFIDNIRYQYFKYFKPDEFFSLPSRGITRRLYKYLKVNTFNLKEAHIKYIKRSYDTLANSIPISPSSPSKVKEKLKSAMPHLLEFRVISDYFFADEYIINNTSENSIYFILEGKKEDLKRELETISIDDEVLSQGITLYIPTDLKKELEDIGVSKAKISSVLKNYSKWDIIKYLLWLKEELAKTGGSPKNNPAGLFIFALEGGMVNLASCHQHILDFINKEKTKEDQERASTEDELLDKYNKYIEHSIKLYKKNHETEYTIIKNNILSSMKVDIPNHIKQSKLILDSMSDEDEKKKIQHLIDEENEFLKKGVKSVKFKKSLNKALSLVIGLKSFSDFKTDNLLKK